MTSIPAFTLLTHIGSIEITNNPQLEQFPSFPALTFSASIYANDNPLMNSFDGAFLPNIKNITSDVSFENGGLSSSAVDEVLVKLASLDGLNATTAWSNKTVWVNGGTNGIPSQTGLDAKAVLESRGCTVYVNS